ncbi:outer membrane protein assembly factor BamD [Candidatus Omnitrophota bacterium]
MKFKVLIILFLLVGAVFCSVAPSHAFWMWTPETGEWINPKYAVKETPSEQLDHANQFYAEQKYKEAISEYKKLIKHYPRSREASEAQFFIAKVFYDQGKKHQAYLEYQTVIDKYPFSERSAEIVRSQYDIGVELLEDPNRGRFMDTVTGNDIEVLDIFRVVIKNAPYGELAAPSQYKIALYLTEKKLYQEARDEFERVINDYPQSEWAEAATYQIAMLDAKRSTGAEYDQKITETAIQELNEFAQMYPDAELTEDAKNQVAELREKEAESKMVVAEFYEKQKNYKAASIYYKKVLEKYNDTRWAVQALKRIQEISGKIE